MRHEPAEHAILGLLKSSGGIAHGYDLMRHFTAPDPLAEIIRLSQPMLYQHLKKLARLGWVRFETEPQVGRPSRHICHLTPDGETELDRWMRHPVEATREIRLEFLVKLYVARLIRPELGTSLIDAQLAACDGWQHSLTGQLREHTRQPGAGAHELRRLVLRLRLAQTETAIAWLHETRTALTECGGSPPSA